MDTNNKKGFFRKIALVGGAIAGFLAIQRAKKRERKENLNDSISSHFKPIVRHFGGCLNPLLYIINNHDANDADVVFDNFYQAADAHGDEIVSRWKDLFFEGKDSWTSADYESKAISIMELLLDCGVTKSDEKASWWSEEKSAKYRTLSKIENGQEYTVLEPYWTFDNEIIEKGLVKTNN